MLNIITSSGCLVFMYLLFFHSFSNDTINFIIHATERFLSLQWRCYRGSQGLCRICDDIPCGSKCICHYLIQKFKDEISIILYLFKQDSLFGYIHVTIFFPFYVFQIYLECHTYNIYLSLCTIVIIINTLNVSSCEMI